MQVDESVRTYGRTVPLRSTVVYGGVAMDPQIKALRDGVEILVATPGRLLDLVGQRVANLGQVEVLVLDEADRMLDMGFLPDIQRIIGLLPARRQNLMFSATFSDEIRRLSRTILRDPAEVEVAPRNTAAEAVEQLVYPVDRDRKEALLAHLIRKHDWRQVLVFTRTKIAATRLASWLDRQGLNAVAIHSDRTQPERTRALEEFKTGEIRVLVATDVAARGLDIEDLPHVVNFELPWNPQDYIHRIGRTGRAGATGEAISLVCIDEADLLRGVQRLLKRAIPWTVEDGFVPDRNVEPRPLRGGFDGAPARSARAGRTASRTGHHAHRKPVHNRAGAGR
jgi:ATP-dependent RNA helicase RhlE